MPRCEMCGEWPHCPWKTDPDVICSEYHQKPLTNADRIRTMSDEELAEYMRKASGCGPVWDTEYCNIKRKCSDNCWLDWLKREAGK